MPVDPFTPREPLSRELLERYAQGRLTPAEEHAVELHLELDPLVREAAEGLQFPGAAQGLRTLRKPLGPVSWKGLLLLAVVAGIGAVAVYRSVAPAPPDTHLSAPAQPTMPSGPEALPAAVESTLQVVDAEIIIHAQMAPEEPAATPSAERFHGTVPAPAVTERPSLERLEAQPATLERGLGTVEPKTAPPARPSRQLVFLHNLKLVHPSELYGSEAPRLPSPGVPANVEPSRSSQTGLLPGPQRYLDFMAEALAGIANGQERRALDDLYFLLDQYPGDVNAQFYAGLACFRLGLYPRAQRFFHSASTHAVDSFNEEAAWYEALCLEQVAGKAAAAPAFTRIARSGGFYAEQARLKAH